MECSAPPRDIEKLGRRAVPRVLATCRTWRKSSNCSNDSIASLVESIFWPMSLAKDCWPSRRRSLSEQVQEVFQNLVFGRFRMCQEAGRRMLKAGRGSILNIGSLASTTALGRGHIAYSMAMGAVDPDDARTQHRMGRPRRARECDPAGAGDEPQPRKTDRRRSHASKTNGSAASPAAAWDNPPTFKGWPCCWPPMRRPGSPAR